MGRVKSNPAQDGVECMKKAFAGAIIISALFVSIVVAVYFFSGNNSQSSIDSDSPQLVVPEFQIFSPQNMTYSTGRVELNVTADISSLIMYVLDGFVNETLELRSSFEHPPATVQEDFDPHNHYDVVFLGEGVHSVVFYVFSGGGEFKGSKTVVFTIEFPPPEPPSTPPTRAEAREFFAERGYIIQRVSGDELEIDFLENGKPFIKESLPVGLTGVAFYADTLGTNVILEFDYDAHWSIFFVVLPRSNWLCVGFTYD